MGKKIWDFVKVAGMIVGAFGIGTIYGKLDAVETLIRRTDDDRAHDRFAIPVVFGLMEIESTDKTWSVVPTEPVKTEE